MSKLHRIVLVAIMLVLMMTLPRFVHEHPGRQRHVFVEEQLSASQQRIRTLRQENMKRLRKLDSVSGDQDAVEFRARTELAYVRPTEKVMVFSAPGPVR